MRDLLAGQIDIMIDQASNVLPQLRAGAIKAFAVTSKERLPSAPEVPTVDEAGLPGLYVSVWHGLWAPKGTPSYIIAKLNGAVAKSLSESGTKGKLAALGQEIPPADQITPQVLGAFQKAEIEKWWPIVKEAGIKAE
jgi:tripartite-type tricarboxylate transporter receptor subunit TctC